MLECGEPTGEVDAGLVAARLHIVRSDGPRERQKHCSEIFFGDFDAAFARFDLSGGGTEQIQFPRRVETRPELAVGCATVWSRSAIPGACSGAANAQRGEEAATCLAAHRPRLPDPRLGGRHIEVAPDSVLDKSVETGIRSEEHTSELQSLMRI